MIVDVRVNPADGGLEQLTLTLDGKVASVPKDLVAGLPQVDPITLTVEWGCGQASWSHPELNAKGVYCENVSLSFDDGPDDRPRWYEAPRVTFTFSGGTFVERRIRRKTAANSWSEGVE